MTRPNGSKSAGPARATLRPLSLAAAACLLLFACSGRGDSARHYPLHGTITAVNAAEGFADVSADAVPGYMEAMTMPYPVPDTQVLARLAPGDEIRADLVVTDQGPHLEKIVIVKKSGQKPPRPSASAFHMLKPGDAVPDFVLVDQSGKSLDFKSFRGDFLFVTFIYTRCPFPDYCPRVSHNFAEIYAAVARQPELASKVRLLSVSFDPAHDTPAALRSYAASFEDITGTPRPFARWDFAVAPRKELPAMAKFFGLSLSETNGQIVHSLSTSLISPEGRIVYWFYDNNWRPADLVADASKALAQDRHAYAASPHSQPSGS